MDLDKSKMKYTKILEISEDNERVYFSFYVDNLNQKIIGVPKKNCSNRTLYAGTNFNSLSMVDSAKASLLLTELMKRTLQAHPAIQLCNMDSIKLLS